MLTFGSLFAGVGGIDLGLERAGMQCRWQVEIDEYCRRVLAKHWPEVKRYGDIREVKSLESVDVVAGGFPCQPASVSGERRGIEDERWLWPEFFRVICMVRPRFVVVENVPGLLSVNGGTAMGEVLGDLASGGYDAEWQVLSAGSFGAPHLRERLFLVAYPSSERLQGRIFQRGVRIEPKTTSAKLGNEDITCGIEWARNLSHIRMGDGIPSRLVRQRVMSLGNAVVPQVAEWIGRRIIEVEKRRSLRQTG